MKYIHKYLSPQHESFQNRETTSCLVNFCKNSKNATTVSWTYPQRLQQSTTQGAQQGESIAALLGLRFSR